jgi:polyisoprenoid-binding protein YceI
MKRTLLTLVLIFTAALSTVFAQDKYFTKSGQIHFFSSTPMEDIEANNGNVTSVIDAKTGKIEFAALMKAFKFKKALMEEHFNENYVESSKFPKTSFAGTITNLSDVNFQKDGTYKTNVKGNLTLHGVTKEVESPATITVQGGAVKGSSTFNVAPEDYKIEIPKLVREKIAKQIKITINSNYQPLNK